MLYKKGESRKDGGLQDDEKKEEKNEDEKKKQKGDNRDTLGQSKLN